ncbi:PP2C family serine/threonine-protein phosphatase [Desulforhabdus sp. TSK]|uniref:PP2C family protein-serine/threonine phosphatase n=1 Tax=Desulforhabdus sp. TSK TaxID=2925014 RepID=UPI001FC87F12|nr:SpoIIE family protein phosphatase [Desulforhabdus sp. TSK]
MDSKSGRHKGGCAGSIAWIYEDQLFVFHAGDTMAIQIRDGQATVLTHSHECNGGIYRFFGLGPELEIDVGAHSLEEGDRVLLFSDGVTKAFELLEAVEVVEEFTDIRRAVMELAQRSRHKGSSDDITVLLFEVED